MSILGNVRWALRLFDAPNRNGIIYGYGPEIWGKHAEGHGWYCGRCRDSEEGITTLLAAFEAAELHANTHDGVGTYWGKGR